MRVHYFCAIALQTPRAVLTRAWASRRVDLRERRVDSYSTQVITFCWLYFNNFLNLLNCLIYYIIKYEQIFYALYELDNNNCVLVLESCDKIMHLRFSFNACALHALKSQRVCFILSQFTREGKYVVISDFAFFVFERTKHQPRRNLRSYLVLQRLCNEAALSPALMHFGTRSWSKMVVRWRYANLSTEQWRKFCETNAWSTYTTWLLMT